MRKWLKRLRRLVAGPAEPAPAALAPPAAAPVPAVEPVPLVVRRPDMLVLYVNLDQDRQRLERLRSELASQGIAGERIAAVPGNTMPRAARAFIPGASDTPPGTLGCYLSHIRAWEAIVDSGREGAIVLEDDLRLLRDLAECYDLARASGYDLVYFNNRMSPKEQTAGGAALVPLAEIMMEKVATGDFNGGTDGYYLARAGAQILLDMVARGGVWGNVDWAMVSASFGGDGVPQLAANQELWQRLDKMTRYYKLSTPLLKAASLRLPAVRHAGWMGSTRNAINRAALPA